LKSISKYDDLIELGGKTLTKNSKLLENKVIGNVDEIYKKITIGGTKTSGGAIKMPDGSIIMKHSRKTTKGATDAISINKNGVYRKIEIIKK